MKYHQALVATDFSEASIKALEAASYLARAWSIPLHVVHVVEEHTAPRLCEYMAVDTQGLIQQLNLRLEQFRRDKNLMDHPGTWTTLIGHPYVSLVEWCENEDIDLLIMGAKVSSKQGCKVGPIAAKCIRKGPADVLLVRQDASVPFRRLLACIDLSPTSFSVARVAEEVSEESQASLAYLMVYQTSLSLTVDYAGFLPALAVDPTEDFQRCERDLRNFISSSSKKVSHGDEKFLIRSALQVKDGIISAIEEEEVDLVCLGTKGLNSMKTLLLGTTAERVISHACCSILAVKHERISDGVPERSDPLSEVDMPPSNFRIC